MERQISFAQYRAIDLTILMGVLALCQGLTFMACSIWFPNELYVASPVAGMVALVMMRWGGYAGIHALLGGVLFAFLSGGSLEQILIYGLGNLAAMAALIMFRLKGKEEIRKNSFWTVFFGLLVQGLMWLGRAAMAALFGNSWGACLGFIITDVLSGLFTFLIVWVVRRIDGLFEDQKNYLLRIQQPEQQYEGRE